MEIDMSVVIDSTMGQEIYSDIYIWGKKKVIHLAIYRWVCLKLASILLESNGLKVHVQIRNVDPPGHPKFPVADPERKVLLDYLWYVVWYYDGRWPCKKTQLGKDAAS